MVSSKSLGLNLEPINSILNQNLGDKELSLMSLTQNEVWNLPCGMLSCEIFEPESSIIRTLIWKAAVQIMGYRGRRDKLGSKEGDFRVLVGKGENLNDSSGPGGR